MDALAGAADFFAGLSRAPDFDAEELQAYDASDELLLATAAAEIAALGAGELAVIGDRHGALTLGAAALLGARGIRVFQDPVLGERALHRNATQLGIAAGQDGAFASHQLDAALLAGARVVLVQLPRGLDALDEIAWAIAAYAHPEVRVVAGGRVKHMTLAMNEVLRRRFTEVSAGLARRKSRVLSASGPRAAAELGQAPFPRFGTDPDLAFPVATFGATFGGATLDHGSRLLLTGLGGVDAGVRRVVDLGCGNGVLAVSAARALPAAHVIATDQSAAAFQATTLTAERAGVLAAGCADGDAESPAGVCVHRADALEAVPDGWAELILLNPPFHTGATVHAGVAHRLIAACARALAPGGELRIVFNSHLRYRPLVERTVGPSRQLARDRTFTVLSARRPAP
ncbi:class I SAM-dependent methyltransferase [Leucobacter chromiireducens]|uniref:class I SAM-dependent methyltransferase n=1 Tax=Leucobacter chromiireducens TaxID=283877 RepID=UPI000F631EBC|nr:methyltransferase [Leucobacter chromiireducens]